MVRIRISGDDPTWWRVLTLDVTAGDNIAYRWITPIVPAEAPFGCGDSVLALAREGMREIREMRRFRQALH